MHKEITRAAATVIISTVIGFTAYAGWGSDEGGTWYQYDSSEYARDQIAEIDGISYAFDASGYLLYGWQSINGSWYYFNEETGAMATGWLESDGDWYYMDPDSGVMHTGWLKKGAKKYYMDSSGIMQTGTFAVDGSPYLYEAYEDGSLITNLLENEDEAETGIAYWHKDDGTIMYKTSNTQKLDNSWQILYAGGYQDDNIADQQSLLNEKITETKDSLYEYYENNVYTAKSTKQWLGRLEKWEAKVQKSLSALGVSQEEIDSFINDIKAGTYDDSHDNDDDDEYYYYYEYEITYDYDEDDDED